eukprot:TRINITY_DN2044_c0_g1_i1.p1 TRINITY_DN2044_c0_g1~~TRINITY_DN2044_c0_g1_i1.p1  ORF type:complete len:347 (-),score=42.74 TRINITY_DN2044_c0_g1_i1:136-1176(-)
MIFMFSHFRMPPICPSNLSLKFYHYIANPSTFFSLCLLMFASLIFGLITLINYNKVKVFDTSIRTPNISNNLWIFYFFTIFIRAVVGCFRYSFKILQQPEEDASKIVLGVILGLHGIASFALALAFYHQHRYRSSGATHKFQHENNILQTENAMYSKKIVTLVEVLLSVLFILYLVAEALILLNRDSDIFYFVFIGVFALQRLPIIGLMLVIIFYTASSHHEKNDKLRNEKKNLLGSENLIMEETEETDNQLPNMDDGPNGRAKFFLICATVFNVCGDLPLEVWSDFLPAGCPMKILSYVDLFLLFYVLSLLFFFLFLRAEYERKKEECMWQFVSKFQDDFNFKRF